MNKQKSRPSTKDFQVRVVKYTAAKKIIQTLSNNQKVRSLSPSSSSPLSTRFPSPKSPKTFTEDIQKTQTIKKKHVNLIQELSSAPPSISYLHSLKSLLKTCLSKILEKKRFSEICEAFIGIIKDWKCPHFQAFSCLSFAKILYNFNDYQESIRFLKMGRLAMSTLSDFKLKVKMYKYMSLCLINLKSYEKAHKYAVKLLKLALIFQNQDRESYAYDLLGKIYFYLGDFKSAAKYHEKMLNCRKTKELVNIGHLLKAKFLEKTKVIQKDLPLTSCEEEDLELLDNFVVKKEERGRQIGRGEFHKGFYSHLSHERGDPKVNLQEGKYENGERRDYCWKRKSPLKEMDDVESSKKRKKMKEFFVGAVKYSRSQLSIVSLIITQAIIKIS